MAARAASTIASVATILRSSGREAPSTRSRSASFARSVRAAMEAAIRIAMPVASVKSESSRIAIPICSSIESSERRISVASRADTFGKRPTRSRCIVARASSSARCASRTVLWGAFSRAAVGNTTKKFVAMRPQST